MADLFIYNYNRKIYLKFRIHRGDKKLKLATPNYPCHLLIIH